jgi:hypothetical protein
VPSWRLRGQTLRQRRRSFHLWHTQCCWLPGVCGGAKSRGCSVGSFIARPPECLSVNSSLQKQPAVM